MATNYRRALDKVPVAWHGSSWHMEAGCVDSTTGEPIDFTSEDWRTLVLTTTLRDKSGTVLAVLNNTGTGDGTVIGDADGRISWDLPIEAVNALPVTAEYTGGTDPRIATWRSRGLIVMDLVVSDSGDPSESWQLLDLGTQLVVAPQISE